MLRLLKIGILFLCTDVVFAGADNSHICPSGISTEELVQVFDTAAFADEESALVFDKSMWRAHKGSVIHFGEGKRPNSFYVIQGLNFGVAGAAYHANLIRSKQLEFAMHGGFVFQTGDLDSLRTSKKMQATVKRHPERFVENNNTGFYCSYWVDQRVVRGNTYYLLDTLHQLPLEGRLSEKDRDLARLCFTRSFLSYLGYSNIEAVSNELLVTPRKKGISPFEQYKIFNFGSYIPIAPNYTDI